MKHLHRLIVTSRAYRMSSKGADSPNLKPDADNVYLWRFPTNRLEAEAVRDSLLAVAGELDTAVGAVMLMERSWVVKVLVLLSVVPIALLTNILRITATGLLHVGLRDSPSRGSVLDFIHDFNGWMMMPVGLAFLVVELWIFRHLLVEPKRLTGRT